MYFSLSDFNISVTVLCWWGTVELSSAVKHSFVEDNYFGRFSNSVSFSPTSVWKFPNTCILLQSLLLFSAYHLQSQIVYWISNIGLSGSQYAGGGRGGGKMEQNLWWKWRLVDGVDCWMGREGCWQDNLTVHRVDESGKKPLQFRVGQNNVMLSDGGKKYGRDGWVATRSAGGEGTRQPGTNWGIDRVTPCQIMFTRKQFECQCNSNIASGLILDFTDWTLDRFEVGSNMSVRIVMRESPLNTFLRPWYNRRIAGSKCANE